MLSIETPSSSSKASPPPDLAACSHENGQLQPPKFSIRDYVFRSRNKDVRINWPFREQLLELCLDHGIGDLLPPLEPPSIVKAHCLRREVESKQLLRCTVNKAISDDAEFDEDTELATSLPLDSPVITSSDQSEHLLPQRRQPEVCQEGASDDKLTRSESEINLYSVVSRDPSEGISGEQARRKYRLADKVQFSGSEISAQEGLVSNLATVSDPMASKVCPVCKSFTSSSNTTLNAHIDQCLSSDQCDATGTMSESAKPKVKPRKKRLMVDIYTTALHCTLEDLDRRNGTNWAVSLSPATALPAKDTNSETQMVMSSPLESNIGTKRTKITPTDGADKGKVGEIYVDSNGTKLLILSKFDDSPSPFVSRKKFKLKKHGKGIKDGQSCSGIKKMIFGPKSHKFIRETRLRRKLGAVDDSKTEAEAASGKDGLSEVHLEEEESRSQLLNCLDQVKNSEPSTLGHWVCSRRSDLLRKPENKGTHKGSEKAVVTRKQPFRQSQPDSLHSSVQRCAFDLPSSFEGLPSPKTKFMNLDSDTRCMSSRKKFGIRPSNSNSMLLENDSLAEIQMVRNTGRSESQHPMFKARGNLASRNITPPRRVCGSLESLEVDKSERIMQKKLKKHRSVLGCTKQRGEEYSSGDDRSYSSDEEFNLISSRTDETTKTYLSGLSDHEERDSLDVVDPSSNAAIAHVYNTGSDPRPEDHEESISRDETLIESPAQRLIEDQEEECGDAISNEVITQDVPITSDQDEAMVQHAEMHTDTSSFQEPNPCLSSDRAGPENTQENSSTTLVRAESNQEHNMAVDMESSGSAISTTSNISQPSLLDDHRIRSSDACRFAENSQVPDNSSSADLREDIKVTLAPQAREIPCSCSERLSRETLLASHRKNGASNLFIRPPALPSFVQFCPSLESRTEAVQAMDSSKSAANVSSPCLQSPSSSNPILRLMGKDLVVSKEEAVQLPTILPGDSGYSREAKLISFGYPPNNNVGFISYQNPYDYPIHAMATYQIPGQSLQRKSAMLSQPAFWSMDRMVALQQQQRQQQQRPKVVAPHYQGPEVILIDDDPHGMQPERSVSFNSLPQTTQTPGLVTPQRVFSCFPPQHPYPPRAFPSSQRGAPQGSSFVFPSPSSLYFSPTTLR